jgi:hypothetical protein
MRRRNHVSPSKPEQKPQKVEEKFTWTREEVDKFGGYLDDLNYVGLLQELIQKREKSIEVLEYNWKNLIVTSNGVPHPEFVCSVSLNGKLLATSNRHKSKAYAKKEVAKIAYKELCKTESRQLIEREPPKLTSLQHWTKYMYPRIEKLFRITTHVGNADKAKIFIAIQFCYQAASTTSGRGELERLLNVKLPEHVGLLEPLGKSLLNYYDLYHLAKGGVFKQFIMGDGTKFDDDDYMADKFDSMYLGELIFDPSHGSEFPDHLKRRFLVECVGICALVHNIESVHEILENWFYCDEKGEVLN